MSLASKPFLSIILTLTEDNLALFSLSLESIASSLNANFELIVLDARQDPREDLRFLRRLPFVSFIYYPWDHRPFALLNKGASLANGDYLHFLTQGEYYFSLNALRNVEEELKVKQPDLLVTGYTIRHSKGDVEYCFSELTLKKLQRGEAPMSLQPLWIKKRFFQGFDEHLQYHGGLDFLITSFLKSANIIFFPRLITEYVYRLPTPRVVLRQYNEALQVFISHFGANPALLIWAKNNAARFCLWLGRLLKLSFIGKK